ncbi:MAG: TIGR04076 family protein [Clostridia bacterium]|nr:TIGR04076 family protein [Clostridia bacterium]
MGKVKLTVLESRCRSGLCREGDEWVVEETCPPICMELWAAAYPYVFALENGAELDSGEKRVREFTVKCPDEGRVVLHGEAVSFLTETENEP